MCDEEYKGTERGCDVVDNFDSLTSTDVVKWRLVKSRDRPECIYAGDADAVSKVGFYGDKTH